VQQNWLKKNVSSFGEFWQFKLLNDLARFLEIYSISSKIRRYKFIFTKPVLLKTLLRTISRKKNVEKFLGQKKSPGGKNTEPRAPPGWEPVAQF